MMISMTCHSFHQNRPEPECQSSVKHPTCKRAQAKERATSSLSHLPMPATTSTPAVRHSRWPRTRLLRKEYISKRQATRTSSLHRSNNKSSRRQWWSPSLTKIRIVTGCLIQSTYTCVAWLSAASKCASCRARSVKSSAMRSTVALLTLRCDEEL